MSEFDFIYYIFMILSMFSAIMVIISTNPVHSVFYLILVFITVASIILMLNVEFIGMIFIIIYVGAIAVLFLFVVMMLNIKVMEKVYTLIRYIPIGMILGFILFYELYRSIKINNNFNIVISENFQNWVSIYYKGERSSIYFFGELLYNYYGFEFIIGGMILLVAMIGTIILTLNHRVTVKRQEVYKQVGRSISIYLYK